MSALSGPGFYMHEGQLQRLVLGRCAELGLTCLHVPDSRRGVVAGWPDCTILGPGGLIFRELKSAGGRQSPEQIRISYLLLAQGADFGIWRPRHWHDRTIERQLTRLAAMKNA